MTAPGSDRTDVLVIGAGPSGSVVAHTLSARGFKVVCLEQGDWINPADLPANFPEWELLVQDRWHHDPNVRRRPADYPIDDGPADLHPVMLSAVGGTSVYYGAQWHRLLPSDFRVRTLDGVASDWPISYRELAPYYDQVDAFIGVSGLEGDPARPADVLFQFAPLPIGKAGLRAAAGMNSLGWHWWPGSQAIPPQRFGERPGCARWGTCEWGCPEGAKSSFDLTFWPAALANGARLVTGARVRQVLTDQTGRATGAEYIDRDGRVHVQRADIVVLAANAIGTARLLLLSASAQHPEGLGNSSGLVGRNLMLHPNGTVTGYYDDPIESYRGPAGELMYSLEFYNTRPEHDFVRGSKWNLMPLPGVYSTLELNSGEPFDTRWGDHAHDALAFSGRQMLWAVNTEDLPEETNRVTLSATTVDSDGIPAPKIDYTISDNTNSMLDFNLERAAEAHQAAGARRLFTKRLWLDQPGHLMGTARMGDDPRSSVTNRFGRLHDVDNVFVVDGSLFVTSGAVNPTATITALALRTAQYIAANSAELRA